MCIERNRADAHLRERRFRPIARSLGAAGCGINLICTSRRQSAQRFRSTTISALNAVSIGAKARLTNGPNPPPCALRAPVQAAGKTASPHGGPKGAAGIPVAPGIYAECPELSRLERIISSRFRVGTKSNVPLVTCRMPRCARYSFRISSSFLTIRSSSDTSTISVSSSVRSKPASDAGTAAPRQETSPLSFATSYRGWPRLCGDHIKG